ncbi:adenylyl-sulfate kinase [Nakamurella sp. A5-74]|uniref:Adenylyl-sulfate kinase n=1 Tax=Nakamurella sp. A5-74 TaxID=3158264 RepID=A0AAU8DVY0_9ACTN
MLTPGATGYPGWFFPHPAAAGGWRAPSTALRSILVPIVPVIPGKPTKIWITGSSGAGKSTLAARLARALGLRHLELDGLYHQANWTPVDRDVMVRQVNHELAQDGWIIDGNYHSVLGTSVGEHCELRIALDLGTWRVLLRLTRRTFVRMASGRELWNGNTEQWRNLLSLDPQENILLWAWTNRGKYHAAAREAEAASGVAGPRCVRLTSAAQVERFVRYLRQA